jgi:hypothetical protein
MDFLQSVTTRFREYKNLAEKAMLQLSDERLLHNAEGSNNSIVVIVKHLRGNMLSRWTNFLTEDGEKPWRQREEEFQHEDMSRERLMQLWEEGWACLFTTLGSMSKEDLDKIIYIRKEGMPAIDAIIRQVMHYSYHVGQLVMLCKHDAAEQWESLSIPRGGTAAFNAAMATKAEEVRQ